MIKTFKQKTRLEWRILWPIIILVLISFLTLVWSMGYLLANEEFIKNDIKSHTLEKAIDLYSNIINQIFIVDIFITVCAILLLIVLFNYLKRTITEPIVSLSKATTAIADGNFKIDIPTPGNDELGRLATNLREMKDKLYSYYQDLQKEVKSKERELDKSKEIERRKDEFIHLTSHELKTPVTTIKAFNQLLERYFTEIKDKKAMDYLVRMDKQIERLTRLINELLDTSRIQSGKLQLNEERFPLDEMVNETVEDMRSIVSHHKIILKGGTKASVKGDRYRLSQVLINLLNNAVKYSPGTDRVVVKLDKQDHQATISVQDFGIGIPKSEQKKIFERFYRIQNEKNPSFPGLGLGLYIAAEIIKRHGGEIGAESSGRGSTFIFTLPVA